MRHTGIITVSLLAIGAVTALAAPPRKYYRQQNAVQKPKDASGTVVVNAASYLPGVSPGGLATVFGTNLTDVSGVVSASTNPFPLTLANVQVTVNGIPAPIFGIAYSGGQDQISFQVPWQTPVGQGTAEVQVFDYGSQVADEVVDSFTEDPGIFGYSKFGNVYAVAVHGSDNSLITTDDPAYRGEVIVLYVTGLGPVDQQLPNGLGAPGNPPANTIDPYTVRVAGENAQILFSGLSPGFVGLYQINLVLPSDLPAGDLPMKIYSDYANSQSVLLSVQ